MKKILYILLIIMIVSITGCSQESTQQNETITNTTNAMNNSTNQSLLATGPVNVTYTFNDSKFQVQSMNLTLYQSYLDFYKEHPLDESLPDDEFYPSFYQYDYGDEIYDRLIEYAQNYSDDEEEQIDYLMSFVSSIEYKLIDDFYYPYEFIYKGFGVCNEKSIFMARLLEEYNYSTALLLFENSNHMAVGIECTTPQYGDYCFMDVTQGYQYITNDKLILSDGTNLNTSDFEIIKISDGKIYNSDYEMSLILNLTKLYDEYNKLEKEFNETDTLIQRMDETGFESTCQEWDGVAVFGELREYNNGKITMDCNNIYSLYNTKVEEINNIIHRGQYIETELNKYPYFDGMS